MSDFLGEYLRCNDGVYTLAIHKPLWSPTIDVVETCTSCPLGSIASGQSATFERNVFVGIAIDLPNT